jgi:hypothetical protein
MTDTTRIWKTCDTVNSDKKIHDYACRREKSQHNRWSDGISHMGTWAQAGQLEAEIGLIRLAQGINIALIIDHS